MEVTKTNKYIDARITNIHFRTKSAILNIFILKMNYVFLAGGNKKS